MLRDLNLATVHATPQKGFAPDAVDTYEPVTTQPNGHPKEPVAVNSVTSANPEASEAGNLQQTSFDRDSGGNVRAAGLELESD